MPCMTAERTSMVPLLLVSRRSRSYVRFLLADKSNSCSKDVFVRRGAALQPPEIAVEADRRENRLRFGQGSGPPAAARIVVPRASEIEHLRE